VFQNFRALSKPEPKASVTVCFIFKNRGIEADDRGINRSTKGVLSAAVKRPECKADIGEVTSVFASNGQRYMLLGLGQSESFQADILRRAAGSIVKSLHRAEADSVYFSVNKRLLEPGAGNSGRALGEGLALGAFKFDEFKKSKNEKTSLDVHAADPEFISGIKNGLILAECANYTRRLAATPPNVATTEFIAREARTLARNSGNLRCTVIQGQALKRNKMVGLINVGKASEFPPRMIQLIYEPRGRNRQTILLIGKTICYDTGGLSIKPREGMRGMKYDKCGGMAVLGAMRAVSVLKPGCRVIALLPTAENSISNVAYRPDDIITYPNGVSCEVTNTDAEGRLVLADALLYGCGKFKPDAVVDMATLTGGVVVALGGHFAGYWCENEELRGRLERASAQSGERLWRLPLHEDYREMMKAKHADIWNSAPTRDAHPIQGAAFLSYFVDEKIPWAHIDIAGAAETDKERPPFTPGPTGFGVRLLVNLLEAWN